MGSDDEIGEHSKAHGAREQKRAEKKAIQDKVEKMKKELADLMKNLSDDDRTEEEEVGDRKK